MYTQERIKVLKAMDTIARCLNDEEVFEAWLVDGVPDGTETDEDFELYTDDETFADIMDSFAHLMGVALGEDWKDADERRGIFYSDGIINTSQ